MAAQSLDNISHSQSGRSLSPLSLYLGLLPVLLFVCLIAVLQFFHPSAAVFEPAYLLPVFNTVFLAAMPFVIAYYAARSYLATGSHSVLLIGSALLVFGAGNLVSGWVLEFPGPNSTVTIHNSASAVASVLYVMAAFAIAEARSERVARRRGVILCFAYPAVLLFVAFLSIAAISGLMPVFFVAGKGPTPFRDAVLGVAVILHGLAAFFVVRLFWRRATRFLYWFGLGLVLIALGLAAVFMQAAVGDPISWVGRASQYAGGIYFLTAIMGTVRRARRTGASVEDTLASFFRQSELHYRTLVQVAKDAIISTDAEGRILLWNPAAERIFGYSHEEAIGSRLTDFLNPDAPSTSFGRLAYRESPDTLEARLARKDGSTFFSEISITPAEASTGQTSTFVIRDVTERKRAEEALRESETRLSALIDRLPMGVGLIDNTGRFLLRNAAMARYVPKAIPSRDPQRTGRWKGTDDGGNPIPPDQFPGARALRGESVIPGIEFLYTGDDGRETWTIVSAVPFVSEEQKAGGAVVVVQDITERKRIEEQLAASREQLQSIIDNMPAIVYVFDPEERFLLVNSALACLFDTTPKALIGKRRHEIMPKDIAEAHEANDRQVIEQGRAIEFEEYSDFGDRPAITWLTTKFPLRDSHGNIYALAGVSTDISERKKAEQTLATAHEELQEHTRKLEETNKELEGFAYTISHDLRAPLRAMNGYSIMLQESLDSLLDDEARRKLKAIETNAIKLGQLVDDLLAFSRAGRTAINMSTIDMNGLVGEVLDLMKVDEKELFGVNVLALPSAYGDPALIRQVWTNLVSNAVKFSRKRGEPCIEIGGSEDAGECLYYVRDNGIGFDMRFYDQLFGVFHRLVTDEEFEGTGVGLAIVHRLVTRHGGRVWAEGKPDEGALFCFSLPAKG
jgi:PAS domain S-box-containing protein